MWRLFSLSLSLSLFLFICKDTQRKKLSYVLTFHQLFTCKSQAICKKKNTKKYKIKYFTHICYRAKWMSFLYLCNGLWMTNDLALIRWNMLKTCFLHSEVLFVTSAGPTQASIKTLVEQWVLQTQFLIKTCFKLLLSVRGEWIKYLIQTVVNSVPAIYCHTVNTLHSCALFWHLSHQNTS